MMTMLSLTSTSSVYAQITPSGTTANLIQYGTSMITRGSQQDLQFNPGRYSIDPDENIFNATVSLNEDPSYLFLSLFNRIGYMNIIVESMVYTCFPICKVHYYPLTI